MYVTRTLSLWIVVKLPDASYAKVSKLINRRLKRYDKNVRPNDTGRNICVRDMFLLPWSDLPYIVHVCQTYRLFIIPFIPLPVPKSGQKDKKIGRRGVLNTISDRQRDASHCTIWLFSYWNYQTILMTWNISFYAPLKYSNKREVCAFLFLGPPVEVLIEFKLMAFGKIREEDMVSQWQFWN